MKRWFPAVLTAGIANDADLMKAIDAADFYLDEHAIARGELKGHDRVEAMAGKIPGMTEHRFSQWEDLDAIVDYLENREKVVRVNKMKNYLEHYQRTLSDNVAKQYAEVSDEVQLVRSVLQRVLYVRKLFEGVMKGLETMHFQIGNVTKLRAVGVEDAEFTYGR